MTDPTQGADADESAAPDDRLRARFGFRFEAGDVLFREGDLGTQAYLLEEGRVRLIKRVRGVERSLMVLKPGDFFGESALMAGATRSSTAIAVSAGQALSLDATTLTNLLSKNPDIAARIVQQLVRRLRDAEDQIEIMMLTDTQSKVVSALLKMARVKEGPVELLVSPVDLSSRVGLDVETVKRTVQRLRDQQYLRIVGERVEIPDVDALRRLYALLGSKEELRGER